MQASQRLHHEILGYFFSLQLGHFSSIIILLLAHGKDAYMHTIENNSPFMS